MCAIGRALMSKPSMILLDEPSMGLAPQLVEEIFDIVVQLNTDTGVSFLLAEQNTNVALRYATHGYILESGRVVLDGSGAELRDNADVKEFYLGTGRRGAEELQGRQALQATQALARVSGDDFLDALETRPPGEREAALFERFGERLAAAAARLPGLAAHLAGPRGSSPSPRAPTSRVSRCSEKAR